MKVQTLIFLFFALAILLSATQKTQAQAVADSAFAKAAKTKDWDIALNEFLAINDSCLSDQYGEYDDWIEIYNFGNDTLNLNGIYITDQLDQPQKHQIQSDLHILPDSFVVLWADNQPQQGTKHLSFALAGEGEAIGIFSPEKEPIDTVHFSRQRPDISAGRPINKSDNWNYYAEPTPGYANTTPGMFDFAKKPVFSVPGGFYTDSVRVVLSHPANAPVHYTTDGSAPNQDSPAFGESLKISQNTVLRARAYRQGYLPSDVASQTFLINQSFELPVISIASETQNYNNIETRAHLDFFDQNQHHAFALDVGVKKHGTGGGQNSLRFYARTRYGQNEIRYKIFPQKELAVFQRLVLRNSGNDRVQSHPKNSHFRDPLIHVLNAQINSDVGYAAYRAVNVFLNGEYYGIYNLRERQDKEYIETNYGYTGEIDFLERAFGYPGNRYAIEGSWDSFFQFKDSVQNPELDMNLPETYQYLDSLIALDEFADYLMVEIYNGNCDWLANNVKFWRPRDGSGKWRWILWDLDHGFGLPFSYDGINFSDPNWNTLENAISPDGFRAMDGNANFHIRRLLENDQFRAHFIVRFCDLLNTVFTPENLNTQIDSLAQTLNHDMQQHLARWNADQSQWYSAIEHIRSYANQRSANVRQHIKQQFALSTPQSLELSVSPPQSGKIRINSVTIKKFPWQGFYFPEYQIEITAEPKPGYEFIGWDHLPQGQEAFQIFPNQAQSFRALFAPSLNDTNLVINEINYKSAESHPTGDWVEIYNPAQQPKDISSFFLKDQQAEHTFEFPPQTILPAEGFLVVCRDTLDFKAFVPQAEKYIGNMQFGLGSGGDQVRLFNAGWQLIDSVHYDNQPPWPTAPDGLGFTLELVSPFADNTLAQNWHSSINFGGSPGKPNSSTALVETAQNPQFELYPNPANNYILLKSEPYFSHMKISIFDCLGKTQIQKSITSREQINISTLETGLYFVQIQHKNQIFTKKLLVKKH